MVKVRLVVNGLEKFSYIKDSDFDYFHSKGWEKVGENSERNVAKTNQTVTESLKDFESTSMPPKSSKGKKRHRERE
ncbi:MAG: hypothetical protein KBT03_05855 [Bacteroidales bacterium]|nr:hypothetical protein [Candidatus Scybalousia scybalohippi]